MTESAVFATGADAPGTGERDARILAARLNAQRYDGLSGRVIELQDPQVVWLVITGRVDVHAVPLRHGRLTGIGRHLFEAGPGHLLPGTPPAECGHEDMLAFRGRCGAGTLLYRAERTALRRLSLDLEALVAIERWVESLAAATAPELREISTGLMEADPDLDFPAGAVLCAPHGSIVWVGVAAGEAWALGDGGSVLRPGHPPWPLTELTWLTLPAAARLDGFLTPARMLDGAVWDDLDAFGRLSLQRMRAGLLTAAEHQSSTLLRRTAWARLQFDSGLLQLGRAADRDLESTAPPLEARDGWAQAFAAVAEASGIALPAVRPGGGEDIEEATLAAGVSFRTVKLVGRWWREDHGPLLGFEAATGQAEGTRAVPLLPAGPKRYRTRAGASGPLVLVDAAVAGRLADTAIMLYRPLPPKLSGLFGLVRFGAFGISRDLAVVLVLGVAGALLGMLVPVASGFLLESVLPRADLQLHIAIIAGLAAGALATSTCNVVQAIAMSRVQARVDLSAEAGIWNRLLRLRASFFRVQTTGDLADRANGVSEIRRTVTGVVTQSMLSGIFALFNGILLFVYDLRLAVLAVLFAVAVLVIEGILFAVEMPRRRRVASTRGESDSATYEVLSAMPKLRAAAAEPRAFARWCRLYASHAGARRSAGTVDVFRAVVTAIVPLLGTALVFAGAMGVFGGTASKMSFGSFVAFQAAFSAFLGGLMSLVVAGESLVGVAPIWERLKPILRAQPETGTGSVPVGNIRGTVTVSNVTFGYDLDLPPVLDGVSMTIRTGEYVALVGPSGSGKSTLVRLMLGLEEPQSGAVYIDGMDLATIDLAAMRRQFGVVTQAGQLIAGSILENILGAAPLPEARAWEAARQAGIEADIKAMPMGMHTVLSEGGSGLSGGQKQRLLIARALLRQPRVLLFDEATSALDNATQSEVKASLDRLNITRIVVAHRLSTIRDVHRVIVMDGGRVVEEGTYDELLERNGLFARLAARQVA